MRTREEILAAVREGRLTHTQAMELIRQPPAPPEPPPPPPEPAPAAPAAAPPPEEPQEYNLIKGDRQPPRFKVATESGWCSVYFDGLRRPVTLPAELWEEILQEGNAERLRAFLTENRAKFRSKKRKVAPGKEEPGNACPQPCTAST